MLRSRICTKEYTNRRQKGRLFSHLNLAEKSPVIAGGRIRILSYQVEMRYRRADLKARERIGHEPRRLINRDLWWDRQGMTRRERREVWRW